MFKVKCSKFNFKYSKFNIQCSRRRRSMEVLRKKRKWVFEQGREIKRNNSV